MLLLTYFQLNFQSGCHRCFCTFGVVSCLSVTGLLKLCYDHDIFDMLKIYNRCDSAGFCQILELFSIFVT